MLLANLPITFRQIVIQWWHDQQILWIVSENNKKRLESEISTIAAMRNKKKVFGEIHF